MWNFWFLKNIRKWEKQGASCSVLSTCCLTNGEVQLCSLLLFTGDVVSVHNGTSVWVLQVFFFFWANLSLPLFLPCSPFSLFAAQIVHRNRKQRTPWASGVAFDRRGSPFVPASATADGLTAVVTHTHTSCLATARKPLCVWERVCAFCLPRTWLPSYPHIQVRHMQPDVRNSTTTPPPETICTNCTVIKLGIYGIFL